MVTKPNLQGFIGQCSNNYDQTSVYHRPTGYYLESRDRKECPKKLAEALRVAMAILNGANVAKIIYELGVYRGRLNHQYGDSEEIVERYFQDDTEGPGGL